MALWSLSCGGTIPDATFTETLEGQAYDLRFRWNDRDESWKCYIGYSGMDPVCSFKMTNGHDLLIPYKYLDGCPQGTLMIFDNVTTYGRPDYDNTAIDGDYTVYYVDSDGIDATDSSTLG